MRAIAVLSLRLLPPLGVKEKFINRHSPII
jgi:hypothetical protein